MMMMMMISFFEKTVKDFWTFKNVQIMDFSTRRRFTDK